MGHLERYVDLLSLDIKFRLRVAETLINCNSGEIFMNKTVAKIKALMRGEASIEYVEKTLISKTPGDVTDIGHN